MPIKVMVVDDSIFVRVLLKDIIESYDKEEIRVVASVSNGMEALREIKTNPEIDVVTLDIKMPEMDGIETLKEILKIRKVPVLMISSYAKSGAKHTIDALSMGALDFITKESDEEANTLYDKQDEIVTKIIAASKSKVNGYEEIERKKLAVYQNGIKHLVAVGSSTGGPAALKILLTSIPFDFHSPIIIAQHMPEGNFTASLAEKLNEASIYKVKVIENGELVQMDTAYLCPGGFSVEVFRRGEKLHLVLTKKTEVGSVYRPSVDMLFSSIARLEGSIKKTAVVLTGMGDDGSKGALAIHRTGGTVIAESERTSVVYGMPKKIVDSGIKCYIADIDKIFKYIIRSTK